MSMHRYGTCFIFCPILEWKSIWATLISNFSTKGNHLIQCQHCYYINSCFCSLSSGEWRRLNLLGLYNTSRDMEGHTQKIKVAARQHIHFVSVGAEMFSPGVLSLATSILVSTTGFVLAQDDPYPACYQFFTTWPQASSVNVLITWSKLWLTSFILDHKHQIF